MYYLSTTKTQPSGVTTQRLQVLERHRLPRSRNPLPLLDGIIRGFWRAAPPKSVMRLILVRKPAVGVGRIELRGLSEAQEAEIEEDIEELHLRRRRRKWKNSSSRCRSRKSYDVDESDESDESDECSSDESDEESDRRKRRNRSRRHGERSSGRQARSSRRRKRRDSDSDDDDRESDDLRVKSRSSRKKGSKRSKPQREVKDRVVQVMRGKVVVKKAVALINEPPVGPMPLPKVEGRISYGGALRPGEGDAIAQYVQQGRHQRMNAIRIGKENQVYSVDDKRALAMFNYEEKAKREAKVMSDLQRLVQHTIRQDVGPNHDPFGAKEGGVGVVMALGEGRKEMKGSNHLGSLITTIDRNCNGPTRSYWAEIHRGPLRYLRLFCFQPYTACADELEDKQYKGDHRMG
ncbi:hypothetical protein Cgig2_007731 [Carnegiea gigantea]|uniref:NF-kappa-B-activating protein C-terminal domain-containing protein n=1 Tax=Carnegiea gigantea TaxID=171969 RepID=A0A9Q1QES7_9CARY|nr:hypothetical protein Cgig2_007731 [Carnegiea gigantea]